MGARRDVLGCGQQVHWVQADQPRGHREWRHLADLVVVAGEPYPTQISMWNLLDDGGGAGSEDDVLDSAVVLRGALTMILPVATFTGSAFVGATY